MQTCDENGDKKTDNADPIYFGNRYHVGDEELRGQFHQSAVADQTQKPARNDHNGAITQCADGGTLARPTASAIGPLNIIAAIIPIEPTCFPTACGDDFDDESDWSSDSMGSLDIVHFSSDSD